ncbi:MAG: alpha/beta fold hydrolase [Acinetobacter tjernbergiae]
MQNHSDVQIIATNKPTIVLVHGAFADGSTWNQVIQLLQAEGFNTIAVQNPLSSLDDDVLATQRVLNRIEGPVILVGHSWGGMVITEAGQHESVKSLVYVAAFAPAVGESIVALGQDLPTPSGFAHLISDQEGFLTLSLEGIEEHLAQDLHNSTQIRLMYATQTPIRAGNFQEKVNTAAWKGKPSSYIISENDSMLQPDLQTKMAERMSATITSLNASHVPHLSQPAEVAKVIIEAALEV